MHKEQVLCGLCSGYEIELMPEANAGETWRGEARMPRQLWQVPST